MYNRQMPPVQQPNMSYSGPNISAAQAAANALIEKQNRTNDLVKTIIAVAFGIATIVFFCLFIHFMTEYNSVQDDVSGKINAAVASAREEKALEMEAEFAEREKDPYRSFSGPADYGELSFEYPKTWSVYIASDASKGGDFMAFFNPIVVNEVGDNTINALRVIIRDKDFESVVEEYQREMSWRDSNLTMGTTSVGGVVANRYVGTIPNTDLSGIIVVFKIRDKQLFCRRIRLQCSRVILTNC